MPDSDTLRSLLLLTAMALLVPLLVGRLRFLRIPNVVGEILAGILIGRSGLDVLRETPSIAFLASFGFIFLMFLAGLELDFTATEAAQPQGQQRPRWQQPAWLGTASFVITLALAMVIGLALGRAGMTRSPILLGLILSTTSLGIVVPVLKDRGLMTTPFGQCILFASLLSDFVPMLLLGLMTSMLTKGFNWNLLLFLLLLVVFVGAAAITRWARQHAATTRILAELSHATAQIRVRGTFVLIALWVVLAGYLGVEVILGAFLAGATIAQGRHGPRGEYERQLDAIGYGFFIPVFFLMVGARFDLPALLGSSRGLLLAPILVLASYVVNCLPALLLRARFTWRESIAGGVLLASRLSLAIAAATIAFELDLIKASTHSAIILVAVITCTVSPILFNRILPPAGGSRRQGVIILGTDSLAELLGKRLQRDGHSVTFLGRDPAGLAQITGRGARTVSGRPDDERTLAEAGAETATVFIALANDAAVVQNACRIAAERFGVPVVVARAETLECVDALRQMQVRVVQPAMAMLLALEGAVRFPSALSLLTEQGRELDVVEVSLTNGAYVGRALRQLRIPGRALVLAVRRRGEGETVVPHGDTVLQQGDVLTLCGTPTGLEEARRAMAT